MGVQSCATLIGHSSQHFLKSSATNKGNHPPSMAGPHFTLFMTKIGMQMSTMHMGWKLVISDNLHEVAISAMQMT